MHDSELSAEALDQAADLDAQRDALDLLGDAREAIDEALGLLASDDRALRLFSHVDVALRVVELAWQELDEATPHKPAPCRSCGMDTMPEPPALIHVYMVRAAVWDAAGGGEGLLCIPCLERLIGRELNAGDFTPAPINDPAWTDRRAPELLAAMRRPAPGAS